MFVGFAIKYTSLVVVMRRRRCMDVYWSRLSVRMKMSGVVYGMLVEEEDPICCKRLIR